MLGFMLALALGIAAGTIAGLVPGIHPNLIASLSALFIAKNSFSGSILIVLFLVSTLVTFTFISIIPALVLGVPDEDKTIMIRPLHRAILKGKAYSIIKQIALVLLVTSVSCIILLPAFSFIISKTTAFSQYVPYILCLFLVFPLIKEKNRPAAIIVMLSAGLLGITVFSITSLSEPLLPLLSGLFGISSIALSLKESPKLKKQFFPTHTPVNRKEMRYIPFYTLFISFISFIPAVSSSQFASLLKKDEKTYALACSSLTMATALVSFVTVYTINKTRNGTAVVVASILHDVSIVNMALIILAVLASSSFSTLMLILLSKKILKNLDKIPYKKISVVVICLVLVLVLAISGPIGLLVAAASTSLGIAAAAKELNRNYLMASLIIPTIFYFV